MLRCVSALYVMASGVYPTLPGVDAWTVDRDARLFAGPGPVVAHPPCRAWGRLRFRSSWSEAMCAVLAVRQVREFGGVLEHPSFSTLWDWCDLPRPGELPDRWGGLTVCVWQGAFGDRCPKPTWLYMCRCNGDFDLRSRVDPGGRVEHVSRRRRALTPLDLAVELVRMARSV